MYDKVWTHKQQRTIELKITAHAAKTIASSWPPTCIYSMFWPCVKGNKYSEVCICTKQNKIVYHFPSTVNLIKRFCFMLGIQTKSMSDRKLKLATDALLYFGLSFACGGRKKTKVETILLLLSIQHAPSAEWMSIRDCHKLMVLQRCQLREIDLFCPRILKNRSVLALTFDPNLNAVVIN